MASGFSVGSFGGTSAPGTGGGFSLGAAKTTAPTLGLTSLTPSSTGFNLSAKTTAPTGLAGFNFAATTAPTAATKTNTALVGGFAMTAPAITTPSGGFSLGGALAAPTTTSAPSSTGLGFGLTPGASAATTTTTATGLTFGSTSTAGGLGGFSFGGTASSTPALGLGGLGASTASTGTGSIFSQTSAATFTGLGGVDPKTSSIGGVGGSGTSAEGKAVKETFIPEQLVATVDELQKYVKGEKAVREDIVRMSSKPLMRVQEDTAALKQLLSVVSNGLQRNACTLDKLKAEMTQELKNAEMAQRTKDIPPGLQYENTAPLEYFDQLVEQFESRMVSYRQQIEMLESHLGALQQPAHHSPDEVFMLIKRQHQSFIALAAQLQEVHEAIKVQKEQFLTYRRIFHGETKNIFCQPVPMVMRPVQRRPVDIAGPTPFPGVTNPAAAAMASLITRPQQHHGGSLLSQVGSGGATGTGGGFGFSLGSGMSGVTGGLASASSSSSLASTLGSLNNTANASLNMSAATKQPFTLQKPPLGAKRGKR